MAVLPSLCDMCPDGYVHLLQCIARCEYGAPCKEPGRSRSRTLRHRPVWPHSDNIFPATYALGATFDATALFALLGKFWSTCFEPTAAHVATTFFNRCLQVRCFACPAFLASRAAPHARRTSSPGSAHHVCQVHGRVCAEALHQVVVVGGEEGAAAQGLGQLPHHRVRQGHAVVRRGAPPCNRTPPTSIKLLPEEDESGEGQQLQEGGRGDGGRGDPRLSPWQSLRSLSCTSLPQLCSQACKKHWAPPSGRKQR